jgi:dTDP-4-dehydrorhamnose reductase
MTCRVVVTGAGGQVGRELMEVSWPEGVSVTGLTRAELDIADSKAIEDCFLRLNPSVVINAAAYTAVDRAETEPAAAERANLVGARVVAEAASGVAACLVHLSTDYVFDGERDQAYREDDPVSPISAYGISKARGERAVARACRHHVILRVSSVFGRWGDNFIKTMLRLGRERGRLGVVSDQITSPTGAHDIALTIVRLVGVVAANGARQDLWGIQHYCGAPPVTWFEFARQIFELARPLGGPEVALESTTAARFGAPARRPRHAVLDCTRIARTFGIQAPSWRQGLLRVLPQILDDGLR